MSDALSPGGSASASDRQDRVSAAFAGLVVQNTNMALVLMGRVPHPETGERTQDLEAAQFFIDQLEMLEIKTKGNLDKPEEQMLQQSLMSLRMAFVEAVEAGPAQPEANSPAASAPSASSTATAPPSAAESDEESRKKFTKKY